MPVVHEKEMQLQLLNLIPTVEQMSINFVFGGVSLWAQPPPFLPPPTIFDNC